jgi:hypothetical protein
MKRTAIKRTTPLKARKPMAKVSAKRKASGAKPMKQTSHTSPLTDNARGQDCQLRLPGCRHDPDYTVFCHIRRFGWGGMGKKPNDMLGYFGCDRCHEAQERYDPICTDADVIRALGNTLLIQQKDGLITARDGRKGND